MYASGANLDRAALDEFRRHPRRRAIPRAHRRAAADTGRLFSLRSPGRKPSFSPASTAGRERTIFDTSRARKARTAMTIARNVLPVPAGPMPKRPACSPRRRRRSGAAPSVRGAHVPCRVCVVKSVFGCARGGSDAPSFARGERRTSSGVSCAPPFRRVAHPPEDLGRRIDRTRGHPSRVSGPPSRLTTTGTRPSSAVKFRSR